MAALHEMVGERAGLFDEAAATLFVAGIAARRPGTVLWTLARRDLFAPGLMQAGLPPDRGPYADASSHEDVLAVIEAGLRPCGHAAVGGATARGSLASPTRPTPAAPAGR